MCWKLNSHTDLRRFLQYDGWVLISLYLLHVVLKSPREASTFCWENKPNPNSEQIQNSWSWKKIECTFGVTDRPEDIYASLNCSIDFTKSVDKTSSEAIFYHLVKSSNNSKNLTASTGNTDLNMSSFKNIRLQEFPEKVPPCKASCSKWHILGQILA